MKNSLLVLGIVLLFSNCSTPAKKKKVLNGDSTKVADKASLAAIKDEPCVFDTNTYKFTTEALKKWNPAIKYTWDNNEREAICALTGDDTLFLHIGGCNYFIYSAVLKIDSSKYDNEAYLLEKARWLADTFFDNGFDEKYHKCISQKLYKQDSTNNHIGRFYKIINSDTSITNHVYDGFSFVKQGARTKITISGYVD